MRLRTILAGTAAFAAIAVIVPATVPTSWNPVTAAEAATSISFSVFYDGLADHGDWVNYDGGYVFVPVIADRDWRPYREGHWIYARGYGWTWVSDEPFGWATYHYGRWGFAREIGWYWVPGTRWAPAWVSWRRSGDHMAWAPLPPRRGGGDGISIEINIGSIPDYYWVAVPTRSFLNVNLKVVIIDDDRERRRIVNNSEFVGTVNIENNIVVNNIIDVNFVEEKTGKQVKQVEVKQTDDPASARATDGEVAVFNGTLEADKTAKPPKLKEVGEVEQNQAENKKKVAAEAEGQAAAPPGAGTDAETVTTGEAEQDGKKEVTPEQAEGAAPDDMPVGSITKPAEQQADKKKPAAGEEPVARKNKKAVPCDPATDSECVPQ
ncbi:MAG: hypothetical protein Q8L53_13455 [Aestuariivirga sp.]|nr:hypothetical protein [Aestuariivirga sp.]